MSASPTTIELTLITSTFLTQIQQVNQNLLLFECQRYSKLSDDGKQSPGGKAIYKRMKSLNEKILSH